MGSLTPQTKKFDFNPLPWKLPWTEQNSWIRCPTDAVYFGIMGFFWGLELGFLWALEWCRKYFLGSSHFRKNDIAVGGGG